MWAWVGAWLALTGSVLVIGLVLFLDRATQWGRG